LTSLTTGGIIKFLRVSWIQKTDSDATVGGNDRTSGNSTMVTQLSLIAVASISALGVVGSAHAETQNVLLGLNK
jgi:hypothetical protein